MPKLSPLGIALIVIFGLTGTALAHAHLKSASPPVNGTVAGSPAELELTFSEGLNLKFSGVTITGPDKSPVPIGAAKLDPADDAKLDIPVSARLAAGIYTVDWHALATDGHKTQGSYSFTVRP